jgi:DNA-binding transcriptional LysR family regulator
VIAYLWLSLHALPEASMTTDSTSALASRLRFRHLQLVSTLHESGSLRAAAQRLHLTQPALSKALAEIESAFGFALFNRNARGLVATPEGEVAVRGARLLLQELAHVQAEAAAGGAAQVLLRIGAPPFVAQGMLPAVLARLAAREPPVRLQLVEERVPLLVDMLLQGRVDALVTSYPLQGAQPQGQRLHYEKLFDAQFHVIAPPGHPLARARQVDWARLATARWIMPAPVSMVRRVIEESFMRQGVVPPVPVIESTSPVTNIRLVAAGVGISGVPADLVAPACAAGEVKVLRVVPAMPAGPVALVTRSGAANPRVALLREALA